VVFGVGGAGQCGPHFFDLFALGADAGDVGFDDAKGFVLQLILAASDDAFDAFASE
jgi:hypothetical protein